MNYSHKKDEGSFLISRYFAPRIDERDACGLTNSHVYFEPPIIEALLGMKHGGLKQTKNSIHSRKKSEKQLSALNSSALNSLKINKFNETEKIDYKEF